jgi:ABC-2 type transport system permease protein
MRALFRLTIANTKSLLRDRAALFWTLAFPLIFVVIFGLIFSGGPTPASYGFVDLDGSPASGTVKQAFASIDGVTLVEGSQDQLLQKMRNGDVNAVIIVPAGYGASVAAGGPPASVTVYTDPSQSQTDARTRTLVGFVLGAINQQAAGRPPAVTPQFETIQTADFNYLSYLIPSILGMSLMQGGVFAAIPLVADREKLILKRLGATPLRRWQLVGSNVLVRLLVAFLQTLIIVGVGTALFGLETTGRWVATGFFIILGSLTFISIGYVIASFTSTEEAANGVTQVVQLPMLFLSGIFFPIATMGDVLQTVAKFLPLTYLGDALRQVMVDGTPFAPLATCAMVLAGWLVVCFGISARFFKWQ